MDETEKALNRKREEINLITAPEELESRLRNALYGKKRIPFSKLLAVAMIAVFLFAYSFDALAYYGRQFIGYENVLEGSLKRLNEEGRGQKIGKNCTFSNGIEFTLDGIMFDDNELVVFYKLKSTKDKLDSRYLMPNFKLRGLNPLGYSPQSGQGVLSDDFSSGVFIQTFESPKFFEKWMKLDIWFIINGQMEKKSISFTLDRGKAMKRTIKADINKKVQIDDIEVTFDSISASAMSTVVNGRIRPLTKEAEEELNALKAHDFVELPRLAFDIVSDKGTAVSFLGGSQGDVMGKVSFSNRGDALPQEFNSLQIANIRIETLKLMDVQTDIDADTVNLPLGDDMVIKKVLVDQDETSIVVSSRGVPVMGLFIDGKQAEAINPGEFDREPEADRPVERIFRYKGSGEKMKLAVKYIRYSRYTDQTVDIPVG